MLPSACLKIVFQETACPEDRLGGSWLSPWVASSWKVELPLWASF